MNTVRFMPRAIGSILLLLSAVVSLPCLADENPQFEGTIFFHRLLNSDDPLAARDEFGRLHSDRWLNPTDLEPRYCRRDHYYYISGRTLIHDPAYVGAMQRDLRRLGYYCGEINGVFSPEVSDAIARMQKHYSMVVTGTLTFEVRRALHLP
jgi:hypothetical protein